MRLAILDDYQGMASLFPGWATVRGVTVVPFGDHVSQASALVERLQGFEAIFRIRERTPLPRQVLERLGDLRLILATGTRNTDSIDLPAARDLGITVCGTDSYQLEAVEVTWWLILSVMRGLTREAASLRSGGWQVGMGLRLGGKRMGIVGLGTIGVPVARIAQSFGMRVQAWSPRLTRERAAVHAVDAVTKAELFGTSDVVSLHMPLSPSTQGLVDREALALMKPESVLVNTSRARLVDESALLQALGERRILGYGTDVHMDEPLAADHPFRYLPNVVATPHVGFATAENIEQFCSQSVENLIAFLGGRPIRVIH